MERIAMPDALLVSARAALQPTPGDRVRVWQGVLSRLPVSPMPLLERIRLWLTPPDGLQQALRRRLLLQLAPASAAPPWRGALRWTATVCVLVLAVRLMPFIFLPQQTVAQSLILVRPAGQVTYFRDGLWQPLVRETMLRRSAVLQTQDGEATVILHDDGVVRLAPHTTLAVNDLCNRPTVCSHTTLTLHAGKIWLLGLLPSSVSGLTVTTGQGDVTVHEGSVSVIAGAEVAVRVWNRSAQLDRGGRQLRLVAGDRVELQGGYSAVETVGPIASAAYDDPWVTRNLARDGMHRREIAQLQLERRAAQAGILPTSTLYPIKRAAEAVDVLFTLGSEARAQKRLAQADTRLNEAAALLQRGTQGKQDAAAPLLEYKQTVLQVASHSGSAALVKTLVEQQIASATADLSAALPTDPSYDLKEAVLQAGTLLPESPLKPQDVRGTLIADAIVAVRQRVETGDLVAAKEDVIRLQTSIGLLPEEDRREAAASLAPLEFTLGVLRSVEETAPPDRTVAARLDPDGVRGYARRIRNRVLIYKQPRSRYNQLILEFRAIQDHSDRGSILRQLLYELPTGDLPLFIVREMTKIRSEMQYVSGGGSGKSL
ncbi:MAG: Uncharacterized protein Greene041619_748 [Candidatus Peregrinibacteria bacterium Greene0416_19]|nr:MAG: Uncharacterized protein Greene041619_748 [Candidatus Peregrinibacteria bacterium Greene0416_19]